MYITGASYQNHPLYYSYATCTEEDNGVITIIVMIMAMILIIILIMIVTIMIIIMIIQIG